jgi:hypothetical protein
MPNNDETTRREFPWPEVVSVAIATISLLVAATSATFTYRLWDERESHVIVEDLFETYEDWSSTFIENPFLSHLAAPVGRYAEVAERIEAAVGGFPRNELIRLSLVERVMANAIFDAYEELLIDRRQADKGGDEFRIEIIDQVVGRFEDHLLINPRLLYLWQEMGQEQRSEDILSRYREVVREQVGDAQMDAVGPIARVLETAGPSG